MSDEMQELIVNIKHLKSLVRQCECRVENTKDKRSEKLAKEVTSCTNQMRNTFIEIDKILRKLLN